MTHGQVPGKALQFCLEKRYDVGYSHRLHKRDDMLGLVICSRIKLKSL